jgi:hypothetical protein
MDHSSLLCNILSMEQLHWTFQFFHRSEGAGNGGVAMNIPFIRCDCHRCQHYFWRKLKFPPLLYLIKLGVRNKWMASKWNSNPEFIFAFSSFAHLQDSNRMKHVFPATAVSVHISRTVGRSSSCTAIHPLHFFVCNRCLGSLLCLITVHFGWIFFLPLKKPDLYLKLVAMMCYKQTLGAVSTYQQSACYLFWLLCKLFGGLFIGNLDWFQHKEDSS